MDTTGMNPSPAELLGEFRDRADFMRMLYPGADAEVQATVELVGINPDLCRVGHELFSIIAENHEAQLLIPAYVPEPVEPDMSYLLLATSDEQN